jgi:hypothetical protein
MPAEVAVEPVDRILAAQHGGIGLPVSLVAGFQGRAPAR